MHGQEDAESSTISEKLKPTKAAAEGDVIEHAQGTCLAVEPEELSDQSLLIEPARLSENLEIVDHQTLKYHLLGPSLTTT